MREGKSRAWRLFRAGGSRDYLQVNQSNCRLQYLITDQLCRGRSGALPAAPVPRGYRMLPLILPLQFHTKSLISAYLAQSCFWEQLTGPYERSGQGDVCVDGLSRGKIVYKCVHG